MASDRDTLTGLVIGHWSWRDRRDKLQCSCPSAHWVTNDDPTGGPGAHGWAEHVADYLIERGVRPPARRIETAEELAALPVGSVVRDAAGCVVERTGDYGDMAGCAGPQWWATLPLPVTVLDTPDEED